MMMMEGSRSRSGSALVNGDVSNTNTTQRKSNTRRMLKLAASSILSISSFAVMMLWDSGSSSSNDHDSAINMLHRQLSSLQLQQYLDPKSINIRPGLRMESKWPETCHLQLEAQMKEFQKQWIKDGVPILNDLVVVGEMYYAIFLVDGIIGNGARGHYLVRSNIQPNSIAVYHDNRSNIFSPIFSIL